jgi:multiple sugar transport system permease protein
MTDASASLPAILVRTSFKRTKLVMTALLGLFLVYTFFPLFYLFVASTKTNLDLFSTFGLWFGKEFSLVANLHDLFAQSDGVFARWLLNTLLYSLAAGVGAATLATAAGYAFSSPLLRPGTTISFLSSFSARPSTSR